MNYSLSIKQNSGKLNNKKMSNILEKEIKGKDIEIEKFLQGHDEKHQYLVNIEGEYFNNKVSLIFDLPNKGNVVMTDIEYKPFLYVKDFSKIGLMIYYNENDKKKRKQKGI